MAKPTLWLNPLIILEFRITHIAMKVKLQHTISRSNNNGWIDYRATSICCNTIYPNTQCNQRAKRSENFVKCLKVNTMVYF